MTRSLVLATLLLCAPPVGAEEGIWLFNQVPAKVKAQIRRDYGFELTQAFLDRLRLASVHFGGASGSFVSPDGLLFTNHHVGADCIHKLSTADNDYMKNGFYAATQDQEKQCPALEVRVLETIEDVTGRVNGAAPPASEAAEANRLKKAEMTRIEKECTDGSGLQCEVVTLYSGGLYHLYGYKKYTDVRLVFAPEFALAFFGGDPDNFTYPRYCLDITFFRAYENGKPARPKAYLKWSKDGVREGRLNFVSGHPGSTGRLNTYGELEFFRDVSYPFLLDYLGSGIQSLQEFGAGDAEKRRIAEATLFGFQNSFKAYTGFLGGLKDPALMARKKDEESRLRAAVYDDPKKKEEYGSAWDEIEAAYREYRGFFKPYYLLEPAASSPLRIARTILRLSEEKEKPNEQRLREYRDSALPTLERNLYSPAPIYESLEIRRLTHYLETLRRHLGDNDETVRAVLGGQAPADAAARYAGDSKLKDVELRKKLVADKAALAASRDGMIGLARLLDPRARALRKQYEDKVEAVIRASASRIALARFAVYGADSYPDATGSLRLSYGPVKGYTDRQGRRIPFATDFAGLYRKATGEDPYKLPENWLKARGELNLRTPLNYVTTNDTHGGNSGSPSVNTRGEIVGILFDGNIESLPNRFVYDDRVSRSVHVASQGIVEALKKVYRADRLLKELGL